MCTTLCMESCLMMIWLKVPQLSSHMPAFSASNESYQRIKFFNITDANYTNFS